MVLKLLSLAELLGVQETLFFRRRSRVVKLIGSLLVNVAVLVTLLSALVVLGFVVLFVW